MEGSMVAGKKRRVPAVQEGYFIRSLSAPMRLSATGELCSRVFITPGTTLTIGRSKKVCDVIFEDSRVSRKHCQLHLLSQSNSLVLLDGTMTHSNSMEAHLGSQFDENVFNSILASGPWKPSLNGIFVNGRAFSDRMMILMPGDEVSLVGPTEGGRGLDFDCPAAVGFAVEMQPGVKKAQPAPSCLSSQALTQHTVGGNFSAPDMSTLELACISHDVGGVNHCKSITLDSGQYAQLDSMSTKPSCLDHIIDMKHGHLTTEISIDTKPLGGIKCTEPDAVTVGSSTECPMKSGFTGVAQGRNLHSPSPVNTDLKDRMQSGENVTMCSADLDSKFLSAFNLVKASKRLRSDLLNSYMAEKSNAIVGQGELLLIGAEKGVHSTAEDSLAMEFMMPTVNAVTDAYCNLTRSQRVDHLFEKIHPLENCKHDNFTTEHTMPIVNAVTDVCGSLIRSQGGDHVFEKESALKNSSTCDRMSEDVCHNASQRTKTMLISQSGHTSSATNDFGDISQNDSFKKGALNCLQTLATSGVSTQDAVSGNSSNGVFNSSKTLAQEELKDKVAEEVAMKRLPSEPAYVNDTCQLILETQTGDMKAVTASLTVIQVEEKLSGGQASSSKDNIAVYANEGCLIGGLIRGQEVRDGMCYVEEEEPLDLQKNDQTHVLIAEPEAVCSKTLSDLGLLGAVASVCIITDKDSVIADGSSSTEKIGLDSSKTDNVGALGEKVHDKVLGTSDLGDTFDVHSKNTSAVQDLVFQQVICNINMPQFLDPDVCTSEVAAAEFCHCVKESITATVVSKQWDLCKEEALVCTLKGKSDLAFESSIIDAALNKDQACTTLQPDDGVAKLMSVTCLEQVCDDFGEANAATLGAAQSTSVASLEQVCDDFGEANAATLGAAQLTSVASLEQLCSDFREDDAATQGSVEQSKSFHRQDLDCIQSPTVNTQADEKVKRLASDVRTERIHTAGYYLNQLKDSTTGSHHKDNTVCLWDLLDLTNDVQALFIATFTYDLEWFLSSAGLSPSTPVTVACHNAKRCWSMASKDRCEKPYLDWPNVSLVYPPFPRSNAFGKGQGIGCHHPKIFILRRTGSLRVIVSSANLTYKQWFHVTNNVWWQDFSSRQTPDFRSLFRGEEKSNSTATPDFGSQLAIFLAALLVDAPSEAHWVTDLAGFDFSDAAGSLVASVPGLHQPLYQNAPRFLMTLNEESYSPSLHGDVFVSNHLGIVPTTVAGIRDRFCASADRNGTRIRSLAAVLNDFTAHEGSTMPVLLKRAKFLKADPNAVSVIVTSQVKGCSLDLFLQEDFHDAGINTMESETLQTEETFIKLGFLPRDVASWFAVLCDRGFFSFAACIWPNEALAVASGQCDGAVKLALYIFQGPKFSTLSPTSLTSEESGAFSGLLKSLHNTWGLWRLKKVLCKYNWVDSHESDFYVASSSIGTSLDAKFLGAFAAAAGRRAESMTYSQESDPQWGCWTAEQEAACPSIGIVFPSINRVRQDNFLHYGLLCFAESAWLRLKSARLLHDAVPYPPEREGFPMHIKVARRRFQELSSSRPYGWMYCGSHNFSPAAWGRPIWKAMDWEAATDAGSILGSSLHICNYELGIVLMEPPPDDDSSRVENESDKVGLDRFVLPFKVPPPIYRDTDRPATGRAMMEAYSEMRALQLKAAEEEDLAVMQNEDLVEEVSDVGQEVNAACNAEGEGAREEEMYVEALWSQIDEEPETNENAAR